MSSGPDISGVSPIGADVARRLGMVLREAGFGGPRDEALRAMPSGVPPAGVLATLDRTDDARLAVLLSLFADDMVVPRATAETALDVVTLDSLLAADLIESDGAGVRRRVSLHAAEGLIIAGDPLARHGTSDFVAALSPASRTVARLAVGRAHASVLDVGTGSGALALQAASWAARVVGVDINPRALYYARLNEQLNGLQNVSWAQGDWFEPVRGQRFDVVLANPPCAVSPEGTYMYRDGADAVNRDELSRRTVRQSAEHLTERGFATVLCNWIHPESDWVGPLAEWVTGLNCDALLLRTASEDPLGYAMSWIDQDLYQDPDDWAGAVDRWVRYLVSMGVERLGWGAIILRRRTGGANWIRGFDLQHGGPSGNGSQQLQRIFAGCDLLAFTAGEELKQLLLAGAWRLVEGHHLEQALLFEDRAYASGAAEARQEPGLGLAARLDTRVVRIVAGYDGHRSLRDLLKTSPVPQGLDERALEDLCLTATHDLISRGFLIGGPLPGTCEADADHQEGD